MTVPSVLVKFEPEVPRTKMGSPISTVAFPPDEPSLKIPPPPPLAELPLKVLAFTRRVVLLELAPSLEMPPPLIAVFVLKVQVATSLTMARGPATQIGR